MKPSLINSFAGKNSSEFFKNSTDFDDITKTCKFSDFSPEKPPDVGTANFTSDGLLFDMMFAPQCGFHHLLLSQVMIYQVGF